MKDFIGQFPWLLWTVRYTRWLLRSIGLLLFNEPLVRLAESYLRRYYAIYMQRLWGGPYQQPEWFDHRADLYRWSELRNSFWVERGVFSREVMMEGCRVLDLCCGDGFYSYHFYSGIASHIDAVDRDPTAIAHARKWHSHPKINYVQMDVVTDNFPGTDYDVIVWDGSIEHFSIEQIRVVLSKCAETLRTTGGILCGYTIITSSVKGHPTHQREFSSAEELKGILGEFFPFIGTIETKYPERHNIYFRAAFHPTRLRRFD